MNIKTIAVIGVIVAVAGALIAFFTKHRKLSAVLSTFAVVGAGIGAYDSVKTQKMNDLASAEYEAVKYYQALYESTHNDLYKEIASDELRHLGYLQGYGYQPVTNAEQYTIDIEGAIQSERDAISEYESALAYVIADATLESDLNRILADENEHINELIEMSIQEKENTGIDLDLGGVLGGLRNRIEESALIDGILRRISERTTEIPLISGVM
jgi:rubrerythrin